MNIKEYYKMLSNNNLTDLPDEIYFDYQGEGYNKVDFQAVNPLANIAEIHTICEHHDEEYMFHFYTFKKDDIDYKGMDLLVLKAGEISDHYFIIQPIKTLEEVVINSNHKLEIPGENTKDFLIRFWDGEDVKYAQNYIEHSSFDVEIEYQNIIEVHYLNNFIVMLCDAKIDGVYGTIADLYCIENDEFIEHWDCFTIDLNQPQEI